MAAPMTTHSAPPLQRCPEVLRRKALAAAATVVLALSTGCVSEKDDPDDDVDLSDTVVPGNSGDSGGATGGDGTTDGEGSGSSGGGSGDDGTDDGTDSGSEVGTDGGDDGTSDDGGDGTTTTSEDTGDVGSDAPDCSTVTAEEIVACCNDLMDWCADAYATDSDDYMECVYGPGFDGSTGCIPWGPPVPPAATMA